jgi:putative flippase GtrA
MRTFLKAQGASFLAWVVDTLVMVVCVEGLAIRYTIASVIGNGAGAVTHFTVGRGWVFNSEKAIGHQMLRYGLVWCGYVFLTTFLVSKVTSSVIASVAYTYPMQKYFVFK